MKHVLVDRRDVESRIFFFKLVKTLSFIVTPPEVVGFVGMALWHSLFVLDPLDGIMFYYMSVNFCSINGRHQQVVTLVLCWVKVRHTDGAWWQLSEKNSGLTSFWARSV